jgi:hypothetical protein
MDFELAAARAHAKYPVTDAVVVAVAYLAMYFTDPSDREVAISYLDKFGSPDIPEILKGEPIVEKLAAEAAGR